MLQVAFPSGVGSLAAALTLAFAASTAAQPPGGATSDPGASYPIALSLGMSEVGLTLAGISTTTASSMLAQLEAATVERAAIAAQMALRSQAQEAVATLAAQLSAAPSDGSVSLQYDVAILQAQSAQGQIDTLTADLIDSGVEGLTTTQTDILTRWQGSLGYGAPPEFSVVERTEQQWQQLVDALRAEARAERTGQPLPAAQAELLAAARSDPAVIEAKLRLETGLPSMVAAFQAALALP